MGGSGLPRRSGSFGGRVLGAGILYTVAAIAYTFPLILHPVSRLAALHGPGDPYLYVWILGWNLATLWADPLALLDGRIFDANIFHPARQTLAYSDHMLPQSLALWPLYAVTGHPVLCYNVLFFASLVASALAMHVFVRRITGDTLAAYGAGIAWGFWPFHVSHLAHLQMQGLYLLPLTFLFLHRLMTDGRRRDGVLLGVMAALQTTASTYYGVIGAVGLGVAAVVLVVIGLLGVTPRASHDGLQAPGVGRVTRHLFLAGAVGVVLILPIAIPYWQVQQREGFGRNLEEATRHAADASSYLAVPPVNALYARTGLLPIGAEEQALFPGFVLTALALAGFLVAARTGHLAFGASMLAVAIAGVVLSLGPDGARTIYATLHRAIFGFHAIRAPARFGVLVTFGLASLAAIALAAFSRRTASRPLVYRWLPALAVVLLAAEYANAPIPYVAAPAIQTAAGAWLRDEPTPGAVLYLPLELDAPNTVFMVQSLEHRRPIVNGASGHRPGFFTALVDTMSTFPDAESLWMLRELDVRFVVAPAPVDHGTDVLVARAALVEQDPARPANHIYEVQWTPDAEAMFEEAAVIPPPDPGPPPFAIGEQAEYDVRWLGAGASLSAGTITLGVTAPADTGDARYQFDATAATAAWVSRFFEARDRFVTTADARLRPIVHERAIREGRRRLDRTARFDHEARYVEVAQNSDGTDAIAHRIPPGTRDAVTAFFYLRSLDLTALDELRLPINEVGRNQTLVVRRAVRETIQHDGRPRPALRVEPAIVQRVTRRTPVDIIVWLSDDERRIPLRFEVSGAFGTVRATLTAYRPSI